MRRFLILLALAICPGWTTWGHLPERQQPDTGVSSDSRGEIQYTAGGSFGGSSLTIWTGNPNSAPSFGPVALGDDVLPPLTQANKTNRILSYWRVLRRYFSKQKAILPQLSDTNNVFFGKFGEVAFGPLGDYPAHHGRTLRTVAHSSFIGSIPYVVSPRPGPEMLRVPARWVVSIGAVVTYQESIGDWSFENSKRYAMGTEPTSSGESNNPVTVTLKVWPEPAFSRLLILRDVLEKPSYVRF
jgi:hypothetical protein